MTELKSEQPKARRWSGSSILLGLSLVIGWPGSGANAQLLEPYRKVQDRPKEGFVVKPEASKPTLLERARPDLPEWAAMAAEILGGGQLRPGQGWFVARTPLTRFTWDSVAARLDRDHDGTISRKEFPGTDDDFRRLDRDLSRDLTKDDFEFPRNALEKSRSRMIMSFADQNHDGKIQGNEYSRMVFLATRDLITKHANFADAVDLVEQTYQASAKEGLPYLSASDLRNTVDISAKLKSLSIIPDVDGDIEVGSRATLFKALVAREIGSLQAGPSLGDRTPDFTLPTDDGRGRVALAKLIGERPVILIFANYTSAGFRVEAGTIEKLYRRHRGRAEFLLVYVREEHPSDGWVSKENTKVGVAVAQPTDDRLRASVAQTCRKKLGLTIPMVVDSVDDRVGILYSGMPDRLYLLDARGAVAYKSGRGPFGFKPDELEQSLILLLQAEAPPSGDPPGAARPQKKVETRSAPKSS